MIELRGAWWLTAPVFSGRASPVQWARPKRLHAPPIALDDLPPIRGVLLSHGHYDHLDHAGIQALAGKVELFLAPLGVGDRLAEWGVPQEKIRQFDWCQGANIDGLRPPRPSISPAAACATATARCGDRGCERRVFFSGDSGYFDGFAEIGRRFGPFDLTLMESGA